MEKEKKGKTGLIVLLIIIILGLVGYICYDKGIIKFNNTNNQESNNTTTETETDIALDDSRFINVYKKLEGYFYSSNRENGYNSFTNLELAGIGWSLVQDSELTKTPSKDQYGNDYDLISFKGDLLNSKIKDYFADGVSIDKTKLTDTLLVELLEDGSHPLCGGISIKSYDSTTDTFTGAIAPICGDIGYLPKIELRKIVSAKLKGDTITVTEKAIYYTESFVTYTSEEPRYFYSIFGDANKASLIDSKTFIADANVTSKTKFRFRII
jgi:hypothetical protein